MILIVFLFLSFLISAQTISGNVYDEKTREPLESVSVYFDNTTLGTTTNSLGYFSLDYNDAINSTLVISYLGYKPVYDNDYRSKTKVEIALSVSVDQLDEVVIDYDDGLTREQKLKLFKREFLGVSKYAKSCKILNEEDIVLRYNKSDKSLSASAVRPVIIVNEDLKYQISYTLLDFEVSLAYVDEKNDNFVTNSVVFLGTSFFRDLNQTQKKSQLKRRDKVYKGSVQHFMRSLFQRKLSDEDFEIYANSFPANPWDYITLSASDNPKFKKVEVKGKISIVYDREYQSDLHMQTDAFYIDRYGNYLPIQGVLFSGVMGDQRIGDILPSDYQPTK